MFILSKEKIFCKILCLSLENRKNKLYVFKIWVYQLSSNFNSFNLVFLFSLNRTTFASCQNRKSELLNDILTGDASFWSVSVTWIFLENSSYFVIGFKKALFPYYDIFKNWFFEKLCYKCSPNRGQCFWEFLFFCCFTYNPSIKQAQKNIFFCFLQIKKKKKLKCLFEKEQ